jgi:multiple antibiotic resistance protein
MRLSCMSMSEDIVPDGRINPNFSWHQNNNSVGRIISLDFLFLQKGLTAHETINRILTTAQRNNHTTPEKMERSTMGSSSEYIKFFVGLFSIVDAIGTTPVFIELTKNLDRRQSLRSARFAATTLFVVLMATLILGETILNFFGISIASFRVGGGILLLLMAINMMHAKRSSVKHTQEEADDHEDSDTAAVVPIGLPLLAGPGAISTVIVYADRYHSFSHYSILGLSILMVSILTWLILRGSFYISGILGKTGINIVTRIMGLIIAAIAVEFITNGLKQLFPLIGKF